jgi:lipopolysaccharide biosynthesis regulator YciM
MGQDEINKSLERRLTELESRVSILERENRALKAQIKPQTADPPAPGVPKTPEDKPPDDPVSHGAAGLAKAESQGRWSEVMQILESTAQQETDPIKEVDTLLHQAKVCAEQLGDYEKSIAIHRRVLTLDKSNLAAIDGLISCYRHLNQWTSMCDMLQKKSEVATDPAERAGALVRCAQIYREMLALDREAGDLCQQALRIDPGCSDAQDMLDLLLMD